MPWERWSWCPAAVTVPVAYDEILHEGDQEQVEAVAEWLTACVGRRWHGDAARVRDVRISQVK